MPIKLKEREYRAGAQFTYEADEADEAKLSLRGMPIVFERPTVMFEADGVQYFEVIARGALDNTDVSDFIFNRNHGMNDSTVFARSSNGSLKHNVTSEGVSVDIALDIEDERHKNLHRDIQSGRINRMSFSFKVLEQSYNPETRTRKILKIKKLYDVSAVDFPAYNDTFISTQRDFFSLEHEKEKMAELDQARQRLILLTLL